MRCCPDNDKRQSKGSGVFIFISANCLFLLPYGSGIEDAGHTDHNIDHGSEPQLVSDPEQRKHEQHRFHGDYADHNAADGDTRLLAGGHCLRQRIRSLVHDDDSAGIQRIPGNDAVYTYPDIRRVQGGGIGCVRSDVKYAVERIALFDLLEFSR